MTTAMTTGLHIATCWDIKGVILGSIFAGVSASDTKKTKRFDVKLKQHVDVHYPDIVSKGVNLNEMLIAYFSTSVSMTR